MTLYVLDEGTDCMGRDYKLDEEYLVFAKEGIARDVRLEPDDFFWYGWTDVLSPGTKMFSPATCMPGGKTPSQRQLLARLGRGRIIATKHK